MCKNKLDYIALQIALHSSLKYFDCKVYVLGVELKHECSIYFSTTDTVWYSIMFNVKQYHLVYYNEEQIYLATLWSAWIFQCINSLNIVQFVVRMRSKKKYIIRHSRKTVTGFFPQTLDIYDSYS